MDLRCKYATFRGEFLSSISLPDSSPARSQYLVCHLHERCNRCWNGRQHRRRSIASVYHTSDRFHSSRMWTSYTTSDASPMSYKTLPSWGRCSTFGPIKLRNARRAFRCPGIQATLRKQYQRILKPYLPHSQIQHDRYLARPDVRPI